MANNTCPPITKSKGKLKTTTICPPVVGAIGSLKITPEDFLCSSDQVIPYSISVVSSQSSISLNGEVRVDSQNIKTGNLVFQFSEDQKIRYFIKETETGFSFVFSSNLDKIDFTLVVSEFASVYDAEIIVDGISNGFGNAISTLQIDPAYELIQADNFEDYAEELGITVPIVEAITEITAPAEVIQKFSLLNEYNFYLKHYEESILNENNLLNINFGYTTAHIKKYFDSKPESYEYPNKILHSSQYMKDMYPILDKQKFLFPMYIEIKFETDNGKTTLTSFLDKIGMLDYLCYVYINRSSTTPKLVIDILNDSFNFSKDQIEKEFVGKSNKITKFLKRSFQRTILIKLLEKQAQAVPELVSNEILMYRLDKFKGDTLLNTQYFINRFENNEIIAFDTQLKYDTEYEYKISKVQTLADGSITETPIPEYSGKTKIIDSAPLPPDVSFIPYKGIDNQILINLNASVGRYSDYPIIIKDSDTTIFNKILNNSIYSKDISNENKIQFEADDVNVEYQLFRLEKPPSSYRDFADSYELMTSNTSILDNINPNTKYYYVLRAVDVHGNVSNPTKPIEIEMVNENGTIYLLKKEYIFGEETKIISKNFKNILQLKPSRQQIEINPNLTYGPVPNATTAKQVNLVLGNKEVSVWNKPFMMRVTSKMTGKKIDIKFKFTYSQPK